VRRIDQNQKGRNESPLDIDNQPDQYGSIWAVRGGSVSPLVMVGASQTFTGTVIEETSL
jgi:hypothetical protein